MTNRLVSFLFLACGFAAGWCSSAILHRPAVEPQIETRTEYVDRVVTKVEYVEKAPGEKTDVDVSIGKQELNVAVNGKAVTINKKDDERFVLDKNKLVLNQESRATLDIKVPTIDKTRRWGIGFGAMSRKPVGFVEFPIKGNVGGWVAGNRDRVLGGVVFKF